MTRTRSLADQIRAHGNDYGIFPAAPPSNSRLPSLTVVVPWYRGERFLPYLLEGLGGQTDKQFSLIVVDDGSPEPFPLTAADLTEAAREITVVRHAENRGVATAWNTGCMIAASHYVLFLDQDMVLAPTAIAEFRNFLRLSADLCIVGFRGTHPPSPDGTVPQSSRQDDWRCLVTVNRTFLPLTIDPPGALGRTTYRLLEETRDFRDFGHGRAIGFWDLPVMVVGHSVALDRSRFLRLGGAPEWCQGWGIMDTAIGALMIADGAYVVPLLAPAATQIEHRPFAGSRHRQLQQLAANFRRYRRWIEEPVRLDGPAPRKFSASWTGRWILAEFH